MFITPPEAVEPVPVVVAAAGAFAAGVAGVPPHAASSGKSRPRTANIGNKREAGFIASFLLIGVAPDDN
jgi:hypothetical protein